MTDSLQGQALSSTVSRSVQRRWVRRDTPVQPFVWGGLLPLLGTALVYAYAVLPFASKDIQGTVQQEVRTALDARGLSWAELRVSGQHVFLTGSPPDTAGGDAAMEAARAATCPTWLGRLTCSVHVTGLFAPPIPKIAPQPEPSATPAAPGASVPPPAVANEPAAAARACEQSLADVVGQAKIEFAVASATIQARSATVLDALAKAAAACSGDIVIEGHTDSTGTPQGNLALSQARAESVREALTQRGLVPQRLRTLGLGQGRPLAPNDSAARRALNRRIEFRATANTP